MTQAATHPMAPEHLPVYFPAADGSDPLFTFLAFFSVATVVLVGALYFTLHALPEKMAHTSGHTQMQVVGILCLLALFTHNNIFWVVAVLLAALKLPDFLTPIHSIAASLETMRNPDGPKATQVVDTPKEEH